MFCLVLSAGVFAGDGSRNGVFPRSFPSSGIHVLLSDPPAVEGFTTSRSVRAVVTLAADTREAVRQRPFLQTALRAGVLNYTAAARLLDVGDTDAVATALGRYAEDLPEYATEQCDVRVRMQRGLGEGDPAEALLTVGETALVPDAGSQTAVVATGEVDAAALQSALGRLATADVAVTAAGVAGDGLVVAVDRRDGPDALRVLEDALSSVTTQY